MLYISYNMGERIYNLLRSVTHSPNTTWTELPSRIEQLESFIITLDAVHLVQVLHTQLSRNERIKLQIDEPVQILTSLLESAKTKIAYYQSTWVFRSWRTGTVTALAHDIHCYTLMIRNRLQCAYFIKNQSSEYEID